MKAVGLALLLLPALGLAADAVAPKPHIVLVGDSTVNDRTGWGAGFRQFVTDGATVTNTALGGRSSKSFRDEGHWEPALALKGDYYLIQFGHNDEPGKGPERETDPATTFTANMARYVDEVRAIGGQPILVTSLVRRNFDDTHPGKLKPSLVPYADAVRKLAAEKHVLLLDLNALSHEYCEKIGPVETAKLNPIVNGKPDTTHLEGAGSVVIARLVVDELRKIVPALAPVLRTEPQPREYSNPIISGDWSDPGVIRVGADYYTCRSSFGWQPGIPIAHSRDLIHWEYIGHAFTTHPKLQPGDTRFGIWGVEMGYNPGTKQFLIYAPTRDGEVFVYYSDKPGGPYAVKSLGANLGIDPGFFADDDGKLYLLTNKAVIHELTPDGLAIARDVATVDRSRFRYFEGPDIFKHGGWYYLLFSDGGTLPHEPSTISVLRAKTLTGPWEADPGNPVMFSTNNGARFEAPAHGTLIDTPAGEWFLTYHAHETAYYTLGRQMLMQPVEWTADGWWRPKAGKVPTATAAAPVAPGPDYHLAQSDEFNAPALGLQWFFTCAPDFSGATWSLTEKPGVLRIHAPPGDLGALTALPAIFQQRVIDKAFSFETKLTFDAGAGGAAGLHLYHDPLMNLWLASTVRDGKKVIAVGKYNLGVRTDLWTVPAPAGDTVHLMIVVDGQESATFFFSADGQSWQRVGKNIYFGASGHHLRAGRRGDPDLGWVGRYKDPTATLDEVKGVPNPALPNRGGNVWTAATFGVFAVQDGATVSQPADFDYLRVTQPSESFDGPWVISP